MKIEEDQEEQIEDLKILDGTYTGIFTVHYSSVTKTGPVTLEINNGKYNCSGNLNRIPAGGWGTFLTKMGTITFNGMGAWSADFDGNLVLHGQYKYTLDSNKLTISAAKNAIGQYEYNLKKN